MNRIHKSLWPHSNAHSLNKHVLKLVCQRCHANVSDKKTDILTWVQPQLRQVLPLALGSPYESPCMSQGHIMKGLQTSG